jgi:heme exporter protein CcmD
MSQWSFVVAAYAVALIAVALLIGLSVRAACRAEAHLDQLEQR